MNRAYVAAELSQVIAWFDAGAVPAGTEAHTAPSDDEELEFAATAAARDSVLHGRPAVVAVDAEVDHGVLAADAPVANWAALFVDDLEWYAVSEVDGLR